MAEFNPNEDLNRAILSLEAEAASKLSSFEMLFQARTVETHHNTNGVTIYDGGCIVSLSNTQQQPLEIMCGSRNGILEVGRDSDGAYRLSVEGQYLAEGVDPSIFVPLNSNEVYYIDADYIKESAGGDGMAFQGANFAIKITMTGQVIIYDLDTQDGTTIYVPNNHS